jgi:hypothetical protein
MEFEKFGKIPRLMRDIVVTEKIDGTNAQVSIWPVDDVPPELINGFFRTTAPGGFDLVIGAGSRNRWLGVGSDNFGFARWVGDNRDELALLGPGRHFGEWWGPGVQRGYGLSEKRFSLFNTHRWGERRPSCCHVVPALYQGPFSLDAVDDCLNRLAEQGSVAAPGFMDPEGVVVYHTAGNVLFKVTLFGDEHKALAQ